MMAYIQSWNLDVDHVHRGHTTRFDLARLLKLDPELPSLETEESASPIEPFVQMYRPFTTFGSAMDSSEQTCTCEFFSDVDTRLLKLQKLSGTSAKIARGRLLDFSAVVEDIGVEEGHVPRYALRVLLP